MIRAIAQKVNDGRWLKWQSLLLRLLLINLSNKIWNNMSRRKWQLNILNAYWGVSNRYFWVHLSKFWVLAIFCIIKWRNITRFIPLLYLRIQLTNSYICTSYTHIWLLLFWTYRVLEMLWRLFDSLGCVDFKGLWGR